MAAGGAIAPFAEALHAILGRQRGRHQVRDAHSGNFRRARNHVVGERGGERLAQLVIRDLFVERGPYPLRDPALDLAVDDQRIDHCPAVFGTT